MTTICTPISVVLPPCMQSMQLTISPGLIPIPISFLSPYLDRTFFVLTPSNTIF